MRVLIVGHGVVGKNLERELSVLDPDIFDKYKPEENRIDFEKLEKNGGKHDIAFICVDTPRTEKDACDCREVRDAIEATEADVIVIKSTVLPGTTEMIGEETGKCVIFSPEYYGGTQHCNNFRFDFTILGGELDGCVKVIQALQKVYDGRHQFRITDSRTAELVKYMENSFLATKVSFCQQFFFIAESLGVSYEELRELFVLDPRIGASHTFVDREKPYWDSHCLNKDVPAIAMACHADLLKCVIRFNENVKRSVEKHHRREKGEQKPGKN